MDPFEPLRWEKPLMKLKERVSAEGSKAVFSPLIEKYILKNPHRVTVEMQVSNAIYIFILNLWHKSINLKQVALSAFI